MKHREILEAALRELVREVVRDELRSLSAEEPRLLLGTTGSGGESDALLTVAQVAGELQVIPATVRTWIQSGALLATRPGNGVQLGRTYRVRRTDLDAFVAASRSRPATPPRG
jgi:excisionase family DNA binding protein